MSFSFKSHVAEQLKAIRKENKELKEFLSLITQKIETVMASQADFKKVLGRIDAATNGVASELKALKDKIAGLGLDASVEDEIFSVLNAQADKLEGIGKDEAPVEPTDPAGPVEPKEPEAPVEGHEEPA